MRIGKSWRVRGGLVVATVLALLSWTSDSYSGTGKQGFSLQGTGTQGFSLQGFSLQGTSPQGFSLQGFSLQGFSLQGFSLQGTNPQGFSLQGFSLQGFSLQGFSLQGTQLLGIDRLRGPAEPMTHTGIGYASQQVQTSTGTLQGLQAGTPIGYATVPTSTINSVQLQAGPADTGPGSYIYVQGLSGTPNDIAGTLWNMQLTDPQGGTGAIGLYVADVMKDPATNLSQWPQNDDITLYTVYYQQPATQEWVSLCPVDETTGKPTAMAVPMNPRDWSQPSRAKFTFACTASGVAAKCARNWGYKPWKQVTQNVYDATLSAMSTPPMTPAQPKFSLEPFYDSCLVAARADYCQDDTSYTKNGTLVDLFDTLDLITSLNPTAGMPYLPGSTAPMMHEEYQISALDWSTFNLTDPMSGKPVYAAPGIRQSGMEMSRYADLDPGRSCAAAPYIDRCDPHEPYACYRDTNMSAVPYGAFLSVNSPRHCDHDEATVGTSLDPMCNLCVNRVCSVDASCCGDPGKTYYPGSLVWDSRCVDIAKEVCTGAPGGAPWPAGTVAEPAGQEPVVFLHGAIGSFEGIVTTGGVRYAEGWACDPDFPGASAPVQISVGGAMGAGTVFTTTADQPLSASWRASVADVCGPGLHGFRFAIPPQYNGQSVDLYVYGIDLNVPGAPFSMLRGGKKTAPASGPGALPAPKTAIWSGWIEAAATGPHTFSVTGGPNDKVRMWVNGSYVYGNWPDPNPSVPGAFIQPPIAPPLSLVAGVRYLVRVEYLAADSSSRLMLNWTPPAPNTSPPVAGTTSSQIPTTALYPVSQGIGGGLLGTYFAGDFSGAQSASPPTIGAVDYVWTACDPNDSTKKCSRPAPDLDAQSPFAARFQGQVMPPVSGDYQFTADTDALTQIWVNGQLVTDASRKPPGAGDPSVCDHDICRTGGAISRACNQGYFCSAQVCAQDPKCCSQTWDAACLQEVSTICHLDCRQTAPLAIHLEAGVKYDIKVELQHPGGRGAKIQLLWAVGGGTRAPIPAPHLFAGGAPLGLGVGLNAAYFSDAALKNEFLDHVDGASFLASSAPNVALAGTLTCGAAVGTDCGGGDAPGQLALTVPTPGVKDRAGEDVGPSVTSPVALAGGGAARGSKVTLSEGSNVLATFMPAPDGSSGGVFKTAPNQVIAMATGLHVVTAVETPAGQSSPDPSTATKVSFTVVDPAALAPPLVTQPSAGGLVAVAASGQVGVGGTAVPNATVQVQVGSSSTKTTFPANQSGAWGGTVALPAPGLYTLTVTETAPNGKTSSTTATATWALPDLTLTAPTVQAPTDITFTGSLAISGKAPFKSGQVIVADGDGRYFTELPPLAINASTGNFSVTLTSLDTGRHLLKIFQRANGLDGNPKFLSVVVKPAAALTIDTPVANTTFAWNATVDVTGKGVPPRTGLAYVVNVYQGTVKVASQTITAEDGTYAVTGLRLAGAGQQQLSVSLSASSLSGAGAVESDRSAAVTIILTPASPLIGKPVGSPFKQTSTTLLVQGTALPNAFVSLLVDGSPLGTAPLTASTKGAFSGNVVVPKGSHVLTARQAMENPPLASSAPSPGVAIAIGDVDPPQITISNDVTVSTSAETGQPVNYASLTTISAVDGTTSVPVTCKPASGSTFALGKTTVTCTAQDAAGNVGSKPFTVTVNSTAAPLITATNLAAEATGPDGAAVAYQVSATGFVANCAPAGVNKIVPCSSWSVASTGLAMPQVLGVDPTNGTLYASAEADRKWTATNSISKLVTSTNAGKTWTPLSMPGTSLSKGRITVAPTTPQATVYVPSLDGLLSTMDGGKTWTTSLKGVIVSSAVDPADPKHLFAWNDSPGPGYTGGELALYETTNGGASWSYAADGLPSGDGADQGWPHVADVAFDKLNPGRLYLLVSTQQGGDLPVTELVFRRLGGGKWQRLSVPPNNEPHRAYGDSAIGVAPKLPPCSGTCQPFPTVYVGSLMSTDGGERWNPIPGMTIGANAILFDATTDGLYYTNQYMSTNYGQTWTPWGPASSNVVLLSLFQDPTAPATIYGQFQGGAGGLMQTTDAGAHWMPMAVPLPGMQDVNDLAVDPSNPNNVYLLGANGVFKSTDGAQTWQQRSSTTMYYASQLSVDAVNPANVYASGNWNPFQQKWYLSTDGAGPAGWTQTTSPGGLVATDPGTSGVIYHVTHGPATRSDGGYVTVVSKMGAGQDNAYALDVVTTNPFAIQALPDAARTIAISHNGGTYTFSSLDAQPGVPTTHATTLLQGMPDRPVFDNSQGRNDIYVSAGGAGFPGVGPNHGGTLYKASLANPTFQLLGGGQATIDFRRLVIDGGSGGQDMYTLGTDDTLWGSHDGGVTWAQEQGPATKYGHVNISRLWTSPIDGALYAGVSVFPTGPILDGYWQEPNHGFEGIIWKRAAAFPPGASVVEGDLRVSCTTASGTRAATPGSIFPVGQTVLTCTAKDVFGVVGTQTVTITVTDNNGPVLTVPASATATTTSTDPAVKVPVTFTVTARDAVDGPLTPTCTPASGTGFSLGVTTVSCTATDSKGHAATALFPVTVTRTGTTPPIPTLTVPAGKTTLEATGASGAAANLTSLVVAKKSTGVALTPTCTPSLNSTFAFGNTTVNCSVTDSGYTVARSFTVVVADTKAPTMTLPTLLPVASQGTTGGAHVPFTVAATDVVDGCVPPSSSALAPGATPPCTPTASSGTIVCAPASNSVFAAGTTAVTCRATDKTGNVGTATFNVVVTDVSPPKLTVPSLVTAEATDFLGARVTYAVSAVDAEDGARPVDCAAPSGSLFLLGDSTVTCQASDTAGNTVRASFTVRVVDTTPPTVSAPATITNEANDARGFAVPLPVTAYDSVSMALTPVCTRTDGFNTVKPVASGDWFQVGETLVTCRATDAAGNVGSATIDVIVTDTTAPVITPPAPPVRARVTGDGTAQVTFVATATDRNGTVGVPVVCTPPSGSHFAFGNTTVNCVARDDAGNEARKSFVVTVYDDTPPVISNVPAPPVAYATSTAGAKVTYTLPTSIDGYEGVRPVACTPASGATFAPNKTTVTCTSADTSKNTATATFTVWVQFDTRQPDGTTFLGLAADGSTIYGRNSVIPVAFALTGASKPITTAVAQATIAPIAADGTVGAFVAAPNGAGTGTVFTYSTTAANYGFALATASLTPGRYRFRADLADGAPHDVDFTLSANSFTLAPLGFTFPPTVIGQQSPPAGFTVVNITTSPISVTSTLAVQVGGASEVQLVANGCTASLAPRAACPVTVVMMPASPGPKNAQLTISAGAGDALTAQISGIAWRPAQLAASPPSISMGSAPFLTPSPTLGDVTVTNVGDQPLGMLNLNLSNPEFAISSNQCPPSLPGGQSCHVLVRFTPTAVGARGGTLSLGAGPGGTATVSLAGTGLPPLVMTPTSFTFPGVTVGAAGPSQTFTVSNIAAVVSPSLTTSTSVAAFRITANTCAGRPLVAGSPCSITVQWFPTVKGTVGGALTVTGGASPWTVASSLTGTGL